MNNLVNTIDIIYEAIKTQRNFEKHNNLIITGNNSVGKTKLIKEIMKRSVKNTPDMIYFIGAKNRNISEIPGAGLHMTLTDLKPEDVIKVRLNEDSAGCDLFTKIDRGGTVAFFELYDNIEKYNVLYNAFFGISISKSSQADKRIGGSSSIKINDKFDITKVSESEAAKMRILMEVNYAYECGFQAVIIDEFDSYFEMFNLIDFINKLLEKYSLRFVFIIHSLETLVRLESIDVALISDGFSGTIDENRVTFIDADDITQIGQVQRLRSALINSKNVEENNLEAGVSSIVKTGRLNNEFVIDFGKIERSKLKARDKILYDYIREFIKKHESTSSDKI